MGPRLEASPRGRFVASAVNGLVGDRLAEHGSPYAIRMAVRAEGRDVPPERSALAAAYPDATGNLVVFVHGLCESESYWDRREAIPQARPGQTVEDRTVGSYADRLRADSGWTPLLLRVNSGLPISENGVALASLLDRIVAEWPLPVRRIAFVGHSMGGLIVRAACAVKPARPTGHSEAAQSGPAGPPWADLVSDVITLGTPHLGAPIERGIALGTRVVGRVPEAAPFGRIFEHRSRGVLDLRDGLPRDVEVLPHARYRLVGATLTSSPRHPVAEAAGDLLVRYPSAIGRPRRGPEMFPGADTLHVPRSDHFDLLNHPDVYAALRRWLS